jgi:hypothetical protein
MREIILSKGKVALVDDEDYERVSQYKWSYSLMKVNEYAIRGVTVSKGKYTTQLLHRFILGDVPKNMVIDHINGNGLDNRKENLRICTQSQNNINKRKKGTTSVYKGVYWEKARNKFRSHIVVDGKIIFLGRFETELEAAIAYDKASNFYHGEFANNNGLIKP